MPFETREGQGALFTNDRKQKDAEPDYRGNVRIGGVLYRLAGWRRDSNGKRWLSLAIQPDQRTETAQAPRSTTPPSRIAAEELDDDIPF
jgi:hypothetical protein